MTDQEYPDDELYDSEKRALDALPGEKLPPAELEERVVAELKRRRLITSSGESRRSRVVRYVSIAAAAALIFALGIEVGSMRAGAPGDGAESTGARQFMLLLFESPGLFQPVPEDRAMEQIGEYSAWARSLAESGVNISGEKLKDEGHALFAGADGAAGTEGMQISAIPARSEGRLLAGYFSIEAASLDEALKISSTCPHLKYGGEIELREIDQITDENTD
ncbi:MAG: hypothetical protein IH914_08945 [candidate division Zixibacteria bacterium]|nr:hypothetical protein [candidate division Zixibacteria bacterium]